MMPDSVREDGSDYPRLNSLAKVFHGRGSFLAKRIFALLALALLCGPVANVSAQEEKPTFRVTQVDMSAASQKITISLHQSAIVQTSTAVARADVISSHIADVQPISATQLLITGKSYGRTNVILWDNAEEQCLLDVTVELDMEALTEALQAVDPQADFRARSVQGHIVLTGTSSSAERAERMVELAGLFLPAPIGDIPKTAVQNHLDVAGEQQVLLRCVVAEVSRTAIRQLGVNGFLAGENVRDAFLVNQIGGINPISIGAAGGGLVTQNIPFGIQEEGIPIGRAPTLSVGFPRVQTQLFFKAMADNTLLRILAEPNLVAISGRTATFLAGGEFPIPVPQGNQQVTIEFREFGVRLNFTPVVLGHQRIRLRVAPEVSELDFSNPVQIEGFVVPGLTTRAAETTVELGNGQTFAIAGLLSEQIRGLATRVPGLGDVPILGTLFRSVSYQRSLTELVILVTPEIVAPLDPHQKVPLPGSDIIDPTDHQLYVMGLLEGDQPDAPEGYYEEASSNTAGSEPDELSIHGPWGHESPTTIR